MTAAVHTGGRWLRAGTLTGELYRCACRDIDEDPPAWKLERAQRAGRRHVLRCDPYLAKKGKWTGRWTSRCDCWGRRREDGLPTYCCSWHEGNPAYAATSALGIEALEPDASGRYPLGRMLDAMAEADRAYGGSDGDSGAPDDAPWFEPGDDYDERAPVAVPLKPYVRRWSAAEVTCPCPTPWDGVRDARQVGYHCCADGCHQNFRNWAAARPHQKSVTDRCKDPNTQLNVDGLRVYRPSFVAGILVWT